jgi:hypothetical protein
MQLTTKVRLISTVLLGVLGGIVLRLDELRQFGVSREAFLAAQSIRYDRVVGHFHPLATGVVACIVLAGTIVGLYELIVLAVTRILARTEDEHGSATGS